MVTEDLDGRDVQVHEDVLERRPVARFDRPALLDQELVALGAGLRDGQVEGVAADSPDDGAAVDILVGHLTCEQLP